MVDIHSENKEGTAANYKRGFGFSPMFCFSDATGEALAARLRPGNATANSIADQLEVLDDSIDQLPDHIAVGHRPGDDPGEVRRSVVVRADSAGGSAKLCAAFWDRNIGFAVVARKDPQITAAISVAAGDESRWAPALTQDGGHRDGAAVAELTDLVDLSGWPEGTRLIVRREPLHPGAQTSLFPSLEFRYWGHYTDQHASPVDADVFIRAHAHVEDHIRRLKASGLERFPFTDLDANKAWLFLVCLAADQVRWFQLLCLAGRLAKAEPKTLRWQLWHMPARVVRRARRTIVRLVDGWPEAGQLRRALRAHRAHHLKSPVEPTEIGRRPVRARPKTRSTSPITPTRPPTPPPPTRARPRRPRTRLRQPPSRQSDRTMNDRVRRVAVMVKGLLGI